MFQKVVTKELKRTTAINKVSRMRFKLERWALGGRPGDTASRFLRAQEVIKQYLPPKVSSAVLRASWNGWCTERRFQRHGTCVFRCGSFMEEDSIEHYAGCRVCVAFLRQRLYYLEPLTRGHLVVLGTNVGMSRDEDLVKLALWVYTLYKTFNHLRYRLGAQLSESELEGLMSANLHEGVAGCQAASTRRRWPSRGR